MTCTLLDGQSKWGGKRDKDGHRDYKICFRVRSDYTDGPANVMQTPGLPDYGDEWRFDDDVDVWAFCTSETEPRLLQAKDGDPHRYWEVDKNFTTRGDDKRCKDEQFDDPLLMPPTIGGSYSKDKEEATTDRFGEPITNSAHEQIRGPQAEFDKSRNNVKIGMNVHAMNRDLYDSMNDTVNDAELWGLPARCWKLSVSPWERKFYGKCAVYYSVALEFEANVVKDPDTGEIRSGWDRDLLDEGTKVLNGEWSKDGQWVLLPVGFDTTTGEPIAPNPNDPKDFMRAIDRAGNPIKLPLDGHGKPAGVVAVLLDLFLAITETHQAPLSDVTSWVSISSDPSDPAEWDADTLYPAGAVVSFGSGTFICIDGVVGEPDPTGNSSFVLIDPLNFENPPAFDPDTNYSAGEVVSGTESTVAGTIRVEKYDESNFLLLGIPLEL